MYKELQCAGVILAAGLLPVLGGCTGTPVKSTAIGRLAEPSEVPAGTIYALPLGRVTAIAEVGLWWPEGAAKKTKNPKLSDVTKPGEVRVVGFRARIKTDVEISPDPRHRYVLHYDGSAFHDDHLCVTQTADGLLTSVRFSSTDRTGDIAVRLAEAAAAITLLAGGSLPAGVPEPAAAPRESELQDTEPNENAPPPQPIIWHRLTEVTFAPDLDTEVEAAEAQIRQALLDNWGSPRIWDWVEDRHLANKLPIKFSLPNRAESIVVSTAGYESVGGIVFRSTASRQLAVRPAYGESVTSIIKMPDPTAEGWIDIDRAVAVRKTTQIVLDSGRVTSVEVKKPSEALEIAGWPLDIIGTLIEMPARFFVAVARGFQSEAHAVIAQAELLKAEALLVEAHKKEFGSVPDDDKAPSGTVPEVGPSAPRAPRTFTSGVNCTDGDN